MSEGNQRFVVVLRCPDAIGIVAAVSSCLAAARFTIIESSQHNDPSTDTFFMRVVFAPASDLAIDIEVIRAELGVVAVRYGMDWALHDLGRRPRVLILVSRFGHCLYDLLHRWRAGLLPIEVIGVASNHDDMRSFVEWNGLPYHHLPVSIATRAEQERRLLDLIAEGRADLVVLARYMQILTAGLCERLSDRCINIHHSFLPSFKGARPYHQAHARGVKMIGATAHYVTSDLDEGPIIAQDARHVSHAYTAEQLVALGQDVECTVLARAVQAHVEHRIVRNGAKTVVFA